MLTKLWLCNLCTFATRPIKILFSYFKIPGPRVSFWFPNVNEAPWDESYAEMDDDAERERTYARTRGPKAERRGWWSVVKEASLSELDLHTAWLLFPAASAGKKITPGMTLATLTDNISQSGFNRKRNLHWKRLCDLLMKGRSVVSERRSSCVF